MFRTLVKKLRKKKNETAWRRLVFSLLLTSLFGVLLLFFRMLMTPNRTYVFISWNLILAWIPFGIAWLLRRHAGNHGIGWQAACFFAWLLFFPNAPYIITDFIHINQWFPVPVWYDLLLVTVFAWAGLILGFLSLFLIDEFLRDEMSPHAAQTVFYVSLFVSSFGIFVGRYLRWNSWDVITHPLLLVGDVANVLFDKADCTYIMTMSFIMFGFLVLGYRLVRQLMQARYE